MCVFCCTAKQHLSALVSPRAVCCLHFTFCLVCLQFYIFMKFILVEMHSRKIGAIVPFHTKRDIPKGFCATGCMENRSCEGEKGEKHAVCLPNPKRKTHFVLMTVTCESASASTTTHHRVLFYVLCHFQHRTFSEALRLLPKHTKLIT